MKSWRVKGFSGWAAGLLILATPHQSPQSLPYSTLPLDLVGVIVDAAAPASSVCLIRRTYPQMKNGIFRPGQKTFDYAEIKEIRRDGIVLLNLVANRAEFLTFPEDKPLIKTEPPPPPPALARSPEVVKVELAKDTVNHYLKNLPSLLDSAFAAPRYREAKNGQKSIAGFEISRIKEGGIVEQLGIRNGDVILEVNGEPLDSLATVMRLIGRIQDIPQSKMTVLRNGQKMNFVFNRKP
jgi:type II secretory pathway component PulC